jgi:pimeloyl-ACP methyl ester carboxylesterase
VVFVHGSMDRAASFSKVTRRLRDYEIVRYDRRGYGRSLSAGVGARLDDHVADLLAVIGDRPAVVIGHSLGGVVALTAAARPTAPILSVGAYEAPMPWSPWWPRSSAGGSAVNAARELGAAAAAERFMRRMIGDEAWERLPERTREQRMKEGSALVAELTFLRHSSAPFDPSTIGVPVVSGYGTETEAHHRRASEQLAQQVPRGEIWVIEGARHGAHYSHPEEFCAFVGRAVAASKVRGS